MADQPFQLSLTFQTFNNQLLNRLFWSPIESLLGFKQLSKLYSKYKSDPSAASFCHQILSELDIQAEVQQIENIPEQGPLLIVANHPFGAVDALLLIHILSGKRTDLRVMANIVLNRIRPLAPTLIGVNPFKDSTAKKYNLTAMLRTHRWLSNGQCLICFPAGNVSSVDLKHRRIRDQAWNENIASLAQSTQANVLPIYIEGKNSWAFYLLGPRLHALFYGRELLNKRGRRVKVKIGELIKQEQIGTFKSNKDLINKLRELSDQLA